MPNQMIVAMNNNQLLGVDPTATTDGATVELFPLSVGKNIYAFWTITDVNGGQKIALQSKPDLYLDLKATNLTDVKNGTRLVISAKSRFPNSNIWSTQNKNVIISLCGTFLVLDSAGGNPPGPQVWSALYNTNQQWNITSLKAFADHEGIIDQSLLL